MPWLTAHTPYGQRRLSERTSSRRDRLEGKGIRSSEKESKKETESKIRMTGVGGGHLHKSAHEPSEFRGGRKGKEDGVERTWDF